MALFGNKKEAKPEAAKKTEKKESKPAVAALPTDFNQNAVIIRPRVTEKAVSKSDQNVYTFVVRRDATKYQVRDAIKALYKVTPVKVNIVNKAPAKRMRGMRGTTAHEAGMKKAYVYLKKGDSINIA